MFTALPKDIAGLWGMPHHGRGIVRHGVRNERSRRIAMITLREIFEVTPTTTRVNVTAREEDLRFIHKWIIGEKAPHITMYLRHDILNGKLSDIALKINVHHDVDRRGMSKTGWGLRDQTIPKELLDAEITRLSMRCADGVSYEVNVDIILQKLTAEKVKAELKQYEREAVDQP